MLLLKQEWALLQGTYTAPYEQPMSPRLQLGITEDSTEWLQSLGTCHVEGVGSKRMSVKQSTHRFRLENTGTDVRVAALKFLGFFSPRRSYHSDLVSYSCLTLEFPLGIQFSFLFGFSCLSTHCLPQPRYLFLNQQVSSLYTFALSKWKHTEWFKSLQVTLKAKGAPTGPNLHGKFTFISSVQEFHPTYHISKAC